MHNIICINIRDFAGSCCNNNDAACNVIEPADYVKNLFLDSEQNKNLFGTLKG